MLAWRLPEILQECTTSMTCIYAGISVGTPRTTPQNQTWFWLALVAPRRNPRKQNSNAMPLTSRKVHVFFFIRITGRGVAFPYSSRVPIDLPRLLIDGKLIKNRLFSGEKRPLSTHQQLRSWSGSSHLLCEKKGKFPRLLMIRIK